MRPPRWVSFLSLEKKTENQARAAHAKNCCKWYCNRHCMIILSSLWVSCAGPAHIQKQDKSTWDNQQTVPPAAVRFRYGKLRGSNRKHTSTKVQRVNSIESRRCYQHLLSKSLPKPTPVQTTRTADSTVLTCRLKTMTKCMQKPAVLKLSFHRDGVYKLICTLAASLGENPFHSLFMMHDYVSETSDKASTCKGNLASW